MLLAGDIGGTKTSLAIFSSSPPNQPNLPLFEESFPSKQYNSLEEIVGKFIGKYPQNFRAACFGVAGPISNGHVQTTNLPWRIAEETLALQFSLPRVKLLNDLEAVANSVAVLSPSDLCTLNTGTEVVRGPIAVIAPGTGLGEAFLTWEGDSYRAHASEGGHCDYAPQNELELRLLKHLLTRFSHVSYERVCSGIGIVNIFEFLRDIEAIKVPEALARKIVQSSDPNPIIIENALSGDSRAEISVKTLELFIAAMGAKAGNLALTILATGGVYIGGGIPPKILPALKNPSFIDSFVRKGRYEELMRRIPLHVILNPKAALLGAAHYGLNKLL